MSRTTRNSSGTENVPSSSSSSINSGYDGAGRSGSSCHGKVDLVPSPNPRIRRRYRLARNIRRLAKELRMSRPPTTACVPRCRTGQRKVQACKPRVNPTASPHAVCAWATGWRWNVSRSSSLRKRLSERSSGFQRAVAGFPVPPAACPIAAPDGQVTRRHGYGATRTPADIPARSSPAHLWISPHPTPSAPSQPSHGHQQPQPGLPHERGGPESGSQSEEVQSGVGGTAE